MDRERLAQHIICCYTPHSPPFLPPSAPPRWSPGPRRASRPRGYRRSRKQAPTSVCLPRMHGCPNRASLHSSALVFVLPRPRETAGVGVLSGKAGRREGRRRIMCAYLGCTAALTESLYVYPFAFVFALPRPRETAGVGVLSGKAGREVGWMDLLHITFHEPKIKFHTLPPSLPPSPGNHPFRQGPELHDLPHRP